MAAILRPGRTFKPEVVPEVESYIEIGHAIVYVLTFRYDVLAPILTELWLFQSLTYFVILWPSCVTFDLEKV